MRQDYTIVMEIVPHRPIAHGAGNAGNEQIIRTMEYLVDVEDPEMPGRYVSRSIRVPVVSGAAMKSTLRSAALQHMREVLGLGDNSFSRDQLRLLLKGGKQSSSGQSVSLEEHRRLRRLFPMLAVFGSMDGGLPIVGQIKVSPVRPVCRELVDAGLIQTRYSGLQVALDGAELAADDTLIEAFPGKPPQPLHELVTVEQFYAHDMSSSPHYRLVDGNERQIQAEGAQLLIGKTAKKAERREANESMPHAHQCIKPGTRMLCEIRLIGAERIEFECLAHAIVTWLRAGAPLGGATTKGMGMCAVRLAGALHHTPATWTADVAPGAAIDVPTAAGELYHRHLVENADMIRRLVSV